MIPVVILAGGNSTRIGKSNINKVVLSYKQKPLIQLAVESVVGILRPIIIVVGAHKQSVIDCLNGYNVAFIEQKQRLGTADAVKQAIPYLDKLKSKTICVGYGDHMMIIKSRTIRSMLDYYQENRLSICFITTIVNNPTGLGRVVHNKNGYVEKIVEEKQATASQKKIKVINTGFYCINYTLLKKYINKICLNRKSKEYYLTDLIEIAVKKNYKVKDYCVDYQKIGGGVNTLGQLVALKSICK